MCWTHYGQLRKKGRVTPAKNRRKAGMNPLERLLEAAITWADCDAGEASNEAEARAQDNLCAAAERYTTKLWAERAREARDRAHRRGKRRGRPKGSFRGTSRWALWRRSKFAEVLLRASSPMPRGDKSRSG